MDNELERRRLAAQPPFGGDTLYWADFVPITHLRVLLRPLVLMLRTEFDDESLWRLADWHEHDGYVDVATPTDWYELIALFETDETLKVGAQQPDSCVRTAFFASGYDFLFRIFIPPREDDPLRFPDDSNQSPWGVFDVSGGRELIARATAVLGGDACSPDLRTENAAAFFNSRYAG